MMNATPLDPENDAPQRRTAGGDQGRGAGRGEGARKVDVDALLRRAVEMIEAAPGIPMSASVRVNRDDLLDLLDEAVAALPDELRAARWLLKERDEYMARTRREAEELVAEARTQVAHMVQKAEVVKAAEQRARHVTEEAEANARRMRREAEDFCDQRLASFENVLAKVQRSVAVGRQRLAAPTIEESELSGFDEGDEPSSGGGDGDPRGSVPFDQER